MAGKAQPGTGIVRRLAATLLAASLLLPATAAADPVRAEAAFREGRRLLTEGQIAAACDKFAESEREEPSAGALLNLARCHGDAGMTASAWLEYLAAARLAREQARPQQAAEAELRAAEIEPRLVRLSISLETPAPGTVVTRNGEPLAPEDFGRPLPVDPGRYVLRAVAPGRAEWTTSVVVSQPGQLRAVTVPALSPLPAAAMTNEQPKVTPAPVAKPPAAPVQVKSQEHHAIPTASWVAGGVGAAALASSVVLGLVAKAKWDNAHDRGLCDASHRCNQEGLEQTDTARRLGNVATGTAVVGAAAVAGAFLFYALDTSRERGAVRVGAAFGRGSAALALTGGF